MLHVELMHNLYTSTHATFDPSKSLPFPHLFSQSIKSPYLVNEMLAFSALHLSTLVPEKREFYHYHAANLQTQALAIFKASSPQVTAETAVPLFLFSWILGVHMLCDTLIYRNTNSRTDSNSDFDIFLTSFVQYLRLHRGVRAILSEAWSLLRHSSMEPVFDIGIALYKYDGNLSPALHSLLTKITNTPTLLLHEKKAYRQAIEKLQVCMNVSDAADARHAEINAVITWPILVEAEFIDLLEGRAAEALAVLAHYGWFIEQFRESWVFGDSGGYIVESVRGLLGGKWEGFRNFFRMGPACR